MSHSAASPAQPPGQELSFRFSPWLILLVLSLGMFMSLIDTTIVNIAIPSIMDRIHASLEQVLWVLNAYSLVYAMLLITSGRLGDIFGPRNIFLAGLAIFTLASALCGLVQDPMQLIAARALQGVGGALLAPQSLPVITSIFPPERRGAAFGVSGALAGLAVIAGPTLGGFLVTHLSWRWVFYVNVPVGIITLILAALIVPDIRPGRKHRLDIAGVLLATAAIFCIVFGLIEGQRYSWGTIWNRITIPEILGLGAVLLIVFGVHQSLRQNSEPLLLFEIFRNRGYAVMTFVGAAMGFAMLGLFLPLTIYLQSVLGLSAVDAGITMAPMSLISMFIAPFAGMLASKFGGKYILAFGLTMFAFGMAIMDWTVAVNTGRWSFLPGLIIAGIGMGCTWAPMYSVAMGQISPRLAGIASGVLNTILELGGVLASASVGALLQNRLVTAFHQQAVHYGAQLPPQFRQRFVEGFSRAAKSGLEVGRGQTGGNVQLPKGLPDTVVQQINKLAEAVFAHGFVAAMRPTLVLPIAIILVAAVGLLLLLRNRRPFETSEVAPAEESVAV